MQLNTQDFDAFRESAATHQIHQFSAPLIEASPTLLSICPQSCAQTSPPHLSSFFSPASSPELPTCTGPQPIKGVYLPSNSTSLPVSLQHFPLDSKSSEYEFVPAECEFRHDGQRFRDHHACTVSPHRALLIGPLPFQASQCES